MNPDGAWMETTKPDPWILFYCYYLPSILYVVMAWCLAELMYMFAKSVAKIHYPEDRK